MLNINEHSKTFTYNQLELKKNNSNFFFINIKKPQLRFGTFSVYKHL